MGEEQGPLGIEVLKEAALAGIKFGQKLEGDLADGKLSWAEGLGLAVGSAPDMFKLVPKSSQIIAEFKDLDDDEREELVEYVVAELDLESDKAEKIAEKAFDVLVSLDALIEEIRA